jgi:hypothetical protein
MQTIHCGLHKIVTGSEFGVRDTSKGIVVRLEPAGVRG